MNKKWIFSTAALLAFLGASVVIYEVKTYRIDDPLDLRIDLSGIQPVHADESAWGGVRQSVTWANNNGALIDSILTALNSNGFFGLPDGLYTRINVAMGTFTAKIRIDKTSSSTSFQITCSACETQKNFKHRMILWRNSDDAKALELYFNDYGNVSGDGAIVIYRTNVLNPTQFNGSDTYVESWVYQTSNGMAQTYSWVNGPLASGGPTDRARIFLENMNSGELLCVKAVIRLNSTTATQFRSNAPWATCNGAQSLYYTVAYGQKNASPFETTAKVAIWDGDNYGQSSKICDFTHSLDFGLFNGNGFITDGVAASAIPAGHRDGATINTLFASIQNDPGAGNRYQDLRQATIDGLTTSNVTFHSTGVMAPTGNSF